MRYRYLLVDNDNTLMDFSLAEKRALKETLRHFGLADSDENAAIYARINAAQWKAYERGETTQEKLKIDRFRLFLEEIGATALDAEAVCDGYEEGLSHHAELLPGALSFLERVHDAGMKIALVSNGIGRIQRGRLSICGFDHLLDAVLISGEIGISKPDARLVELALAQLGCTNQAEAVLLGDSLTADIAAANNAGIDSIWLNLNGAASDQPTYTVSTLAEAGTLLTSL